MAHACSDKITVWGLALTAAVVTAACTSTAPSKLSPQQRTAIEGKSVALEQVQPTHFSLVSSSAVLAGALDPFMAGANAVKGQKAGDMIVEQDRLVDPVTVIAPALLTELKAMYGIKDTDGGLLATAAGSARPSAVADLVLSVEVPVWSTMYLPMNLNRYGVMLVARAKMVDGVTAKSLREARCIIRPRNQPDAPTFTELMENNGVRLRAEVDYATQACIQVLKQSLLGE